MVQLMLLKMVLCYKGGLFQMYIQVLEGKFRLKRAAERSQQSSETIAFNLSFWSLRFL